MRRESHKILGEVISEELLTESNHFEKALFCLGCREPDYNYLTYIKGSIREEALHGHNYNNARNYIRRLSASLESAVFHGPLFHYNLGKLTHYILDAFTYVHNELFDGTIAEHVRYEHSMSPLFEKLLKQGYQEKIEFQESIAKTLEELHSKYLENWSDMRDDCVYSISLVREAVGLLIKPQYIINPFSRPLLLLPALPGINFI